MRRRARVVAQRSARQRTMRRGGRRSLLVGVLPRRAHKEAGLLGEARRGAGLAARPTRAPSSARSPPREARARRDRLALVAPGRPAGARRARRRSGRPSPDDARRCPCATPPALPIPCVTIASSPRRRPPGRATSVLDPRLVMQKNPITPEGAARLREELISLKSVERPAIIQAIATAREHGDLSENAEYHAARDKQSFIEGRIKEIENKLALAEVIDPTKLAGDRVAFGATVKLSNTDTGEEVDLPHPRRRRGGPGEGEHQRHEPARALAHRQRGGRRGEGAHAGRRADLRSARHRVRVSERARLLAHRARREGVARRGAAGRGARGARGGDRARRPSRCPRRGARTGRSSLAGFAATRTRRSAGRASRGCCARAGCSTARSAIASGGRSRSAWDDPVERADGVGPTSRREAGGARRVASRRTSSGRCRSAGTTCARRSGWRRRSRVPARRRRRSRRRRGSASAGVGEERERSCRCGDGGRCGSCSPTPRTGRRRSTRGGSTRRTACSRRQGQGAPCLVVGRVRVRDGQAPDRMAHPDLLRDEPAARGIRPRYRVAGDAPGDAAAGGRATPWRAPRRCPIPCPPPIAAREAMPDGRAAAARRARRRLRAPPRRTRGAPWPSASAWVEAFTRVWQRMLSEARRGAGRARRSCRGRAVARRASSTRSAFR